MLGLAPRDAVLITIDDGYESVYTIAYPLLRQYGMHATAFVLTTRVGEANTVNPHQPWLSWEQCREMEQSGHIDIEAHGHESHSAAHGLYEGEVGSGPFFLTRLVDTSTGTPERDLSYHGRLLRDLTECKRRIDEALQKDVVAFCWPFGKANAECIAAADEAGYSVTFTLGAPNSIAGARDRFRSPEAWSLVTGMLEPGPEPPPGEEPGPQVAEPEPPATEEPVAAETALAADDATAEGPIWPWYLALALAAVAIVVGFVALYRSTRPPGQPR